jgi:dipicolinate synthase subunit A
LFKVFARNSRDRLLASMDGAKGLDISEIPDSISDTDVIINTVPAVIMGEKELLRHKKELIIIELASLPGGVYDNTCRSLGIRLISARSLPGRFSAGSSAHYIIESISDILKESEVIL